MYEIYIRYEGGSLHKDTDIFPTFAGACLAAAQAMVYREPDGAFGFLSAVSVKPMDSTDSLAEYTRRADRIQCEAICVEWQYMIAREIARIVSDEMNARAGTYQRRPVRSRD